MLKIFAIFISLMMVTGSAQAFEQDSRYYPNYTHRTVGGVPNITRSGGGMIYMRSGGHIYRLVRHSDGTYWAASSWPKLETRLEAEHPDAIIDIPAGTNPVVLIIDGKRVMFNASDLFSQGHRNFAALNGTSSSGGSTSTSGGQRPAQQHQDTTPISSGGHNGSVALCQLTGSCQGSTSSSSSGASSSGASSSSTSSGGGSSSGSSSGAYTGGPISIPPAPAACKSTTATATVTPSNFNSAVAALSGGRTLVLSPGNYPSLSLNGKNFGGATIQCAEPGACRFPNGKLYNVSNLTVDGIFIAGGNIALDLKGTSNMTVRCSTFHEMEGTGVLVVRNTGSLKLQNNTVINHKLGCSSLNKSECGHKSDGSVLPLTDYGFRLHIVQDAQIIGNRFDGMFNHAISLKERIPTAVINKNTFNNCGRTCLELGQEPSTTAAGDISCGQAVVTENVFNNVRRPEELTVLLVKNIHRVTYSNNIFNNVTARRLSLHVFNKVPASPKGQKPGQLITGGIPADRSVTGTDAH